MQWQIPRRARWLLLAATALLVPMTALSGCDEAPMKAATSPPPAVVVVLPTERDVTDYVDFTGRTAALDSVEIRPRVSGYLVRMPFQEGTEVKAGDLLFEIDPRPYEAALHKAQAEVLVAEAKRVRAIADLARANAVNARVPNSISQQDIDQYTATRDASAADKKVAEAAVESAEIDVKFTKVTAPVAGAISKYYLTVGNLVNKDDTLLTTIVSQDPMYVYFDVDERTMMRVVRSRVDAKDDPIAERKVPVLISLADEDRFLHRGYVNFANNAVDGSSGTIVGRGVFANPPFPSGARLLRPGMFVRVRLLLGPPYKATVVPERALGSDQGDKYLLIVDAKDTVEYRKVSVGPLQEDGTRVVAQGLKSGERVIVSGLQLVRPGTKVVVEPAAASPAAAPTPPAGR